MTFPICSTCGTQFGAGQPPEHCPVCEDERQYVGWQGQGWTDMAGLRRDHCLRIGEDAGLLAIDLPGFAIPQRMLLLPTGDGHLLWECLSLVSDEAVEALRASGGVDAIVISHPHFHASMVEWSEALGGVPILLHAASRQWVQRQSPRIDTLPNASVSRGPVSISATANTSQPIARTLRRRITTIWNLDEGRRDVTCPGGISRRLCFALGIGTQGGLSRTVGNPWVVASHPFLTRNRTGIRGAHHGKS